MSMRFNYLFLFIFLFTQVSAQDSWLGLSFDEKLAQPEMFIFEPHYDENSKIEYYSFANIFKIEYKKNTKGLPDKKIIRQWDRYHYQWGIVIETFFYYDKQDRLVEERTEQLVPKIYNGNTVGYPKTTIMVKQIHYDEQNHTETVRKIINVPEFSRNQGYNDSIITVRYMNKFNLPDSMVIQTKDGNLTYYNKLIYSYDKKQRNIGIEYFSKYDTIFRKDNIVKVKYGKNKITYTQTPVVYEEDPTTYDEWWVYQYKKPEKLVMEIGYDDRQRIVSKKITTGNSVILFSEYHYDKHGNTNVTHEQNTELMSLFSSFFFNVKIPDMFRYLKYSVQYDEHCVCGTYYIKNKEKKLLKLAEITNCYSPDGLLLSNDMIRYYDSDGDFDDRERVEFRYNKDGLSGEYIVYRARDKEEAKDMMNQQRTKVIFKKDTSGNQLYKEKYNYSYEQEWKPEEKTTKKFDKNGYEIFYKNERYSSSDNAWEKYSEIKYVRDSLNRILMQEDADYRYCYRYNDRHITTLKEKYRRDNKNKFWEGIYKDSMIYNNADELIEEIECQWVGERNDWEPKTRRIYNKQSEGNEQKTIYQWKNDRWIHQKLNYKKQIVTEDTTTIEIGSLEWNTNNNQWEVKWFERTTSNEKYHSAIRETCAWNDKFDILEGEEYIVTQGGGHTKVYSLWNYDLNRWNDTIRHTIQFNNRKQNYSYWNYHPIYLVSVPDDSCYHIFENYDSNHHRWIPEKRFEITNPSDSIYQVVLETWNLERSVWEKKTKLWVYRNQDEENYKNELSDYDNATNRWKVQYKGEDGKMNEQTGTFYQKWNTQKQQWQPLFFNGKNDDYLWNLKTNTWEEKDFWTPVSEELKAINKALFPDIRVDYDRIRIQNRDEKMSTLE